VNWDPKLAARTDHLMAICAFRQTLTVRHLPPCPKTKVDEPMR